MVGHRRAACVTQNTNLGKISTGSILIAYCTRAVVCSQRGCTAANPSPWPGVFCCCQIKQLYGVDPTLKFKIIFVVCLQVAGAAVASHLSSWWAWLAWTYVVGGTFNHTLTLGMHEVSHNLAFRSFFLNKLFGMFTNLPLGIPSFMYACMLYLLFLPLLAGPSPRSCPL